MRAFALLLVGLMYVTGAETRVGARITPPRVDRRRPQAEALGILLTKTAGYLDGYQQSLATVIAEETYSLHGPAWGGATRDLVSDILLVGSDGSWVEFRDVFQVNHRAVRDHDARLEALLSSPTDVLTRAQRIADESARYNGTIIPRNINVPTMALTYLTRANQPRSSFERLGSDAASVIVGFHETAQPPLIHTPFGTTATSGRFWIDSASGAVTKSELRVKVAQSAAINQDFAVSGTITVTYERDPSLKLLVPREMDEAYTQPAEVRGHATYSNYKAFGVVVTTSRGRGGA